MALVRSIVIKSIIITEVYVNNVLQIVKLVMIPLQLNVLLAWVLINYITIHAYQFVMVTDIYLLTHSIVSTVMFPAMVVIMVIRMQTVFYVLQIILHNLENA